MTLRRAASAVIAARARAPIVGFRARIGPAAPVKSDGHQVPSRRSRMYARVATFQGDPANVDAAIERVRAEVEGTPPPGLEGAKMLMLVDRQSGKGVGITLFDSEAAMRRGDEALNAMNPGDAGSRTSVEFYEVPVET